VGAARRSASGLISDGDSLSIREGHLFVEEVEASAIARRFGTPLYVESEAQLRSNARRFTAALRAAWPVGPVRVLPSLKANYTMATRCILSEEGMGCDTYGAGEFSIALRCGVPPELISVNGSIKDLDLITEAIEVGARITLDSERELDLVLEAASRLGTKARVRLRIRPDYAELDAPTDFVEDEMSVRDAADAYKAGIPVSDVELMGKRALGSEDVELTGLMAHLGRHRADLDTWRRMVVAFVRSMAHLSEAWGGWLPREIDLGGGYAVRRDPTGRLLSRLADRHEAAPSIEAYCAVLGETLRAEMDRWNLPHEGVALEIEPGRSMYADTGIHLATVRNIKRQGGGSPRVWVETDTTEMFLIDSLIEHNRWVPLVCDRADAPPTATVDLVGKSCGFDVLVPDVDLPDVEVGDVVAILDTGAYADATSTNFNVLPRPATVLVIGDAAEIIKRAETIEDILRRDVVPSRYSVSPGGPRG
jgi:diaminopimelate decarboxylase